MAVKKEYYIDPLEFKNAIRLYYTDGNCTDYLGECLNKISKNLSYSPCFVNYSYKEDMIGDALVKMFSALKRKTFNTESDTSPFSYFTTISFHAFINRIKKENKHHETLKQYTEKCYADLLTDSKGSGHIYIKPKITEGDDYDVD